MNREYKITLANKDQRTVKGRVKGEWGVHRHDKNCYVLTYIPSSHVAICFYQARPAWRVQDRLAYSAYPNPLKTTGGFREHLFRIIDVVEKELGKKRIWFF